jgi:hypothetical protein
VLLIALLISLFPAVTNAAIFIPIARVGQAPESIGANLTAGPIPFPDGFMQSVKSYGAKGDGVSDDTTAIQRALDDQRVGNDGKPLHNDFFGRPKMLYFPAGIYLVNDTLSWIGCCVTLQGQGSSATVIRLKDGATGFNDPSKPKPLIVTQDGNMSFRQNIWDLQINTGRNNPGAVGLDWISNNWGSLRNLLIRSEDGSGVRGLDMTRTWPGPSLATNLKVEGFDYGIDIGTTEYGPTFEHITLEKQNKIALRIDANTVAMRSLRSINSVPAIQTSKNWSSLILIDAELNGGASSNIAITVDGDLYARNVTTSGYSAAIKKDATTLPGTAVSEYVAGTVRSLFNANPPARSLNLPIRDTPTYQDSDLNQWGRFETSFYGDTSKLQALLNSGKATIYFPAGGYFSFDERVVTVPATVKRIVGFASIINGDARGRNGGRIKLVVSDNSSEPLIIEQFGYGMKVEQRGKRPIVLRAGSYKYTSTPGAGDLFLEDVGMEPLIIQPGQRVWARQLNNEYGDGTKIVNNGGTLWLFGLKTERAQTVIETSNNGQTELLGTLIYPSRAVPDTDIAFVSRDSQMSLIYSQSVYCANCGYDTDVQETRNGETRRLPAKDVGGRMALYVGY